ncbi:MAG TPA: hypothetical protein ENH99_00130 [Candidatus Pacearchaeota archaeon]|nr:hypothetical protein [Candidatus Pacearchaeota archaeon]
MIKLNLRELVKALVWFVFLASGVFIYITIFQYIPIVLMLAALSTGSETLANHIPMFINLWMGFNIVFVLSAFVLVVEKCFIKKKVKKK